MISFSSSSTSSGGSDERLNVTNESKKKGKREKFLRAVRQLEKMSKFRWRDAFAVSLFPFGNFQRRGPILFIIRRKVFPFVRLDN